MVTHNSYDVLVVGGGPSGLLLAGDIAQAGYSVGVLEKHLNVNPFTRALGLFPRTIELLAARGIAESLLAQGVTVPIAAMNRFFHGNLSQFPTPYPFLLTLAQPFIDAEIEKYAVSSGAEIFRGFTATKVNNNLNLNTVTAQDTNQHTHYFTGKYLVAADGWKSTIRQLLNIDFPGKTVIQACAIADVILTENPMKYFKSGGNLGKTQNITTFAMPYGYDNKLRIAIMDNSITDVNAPVTDKQIITAIKECYGVDISLSECSDKRRFSSDERLMAQYRCGNVFFVGDAAHCHSPAGGQGLNTGLQDSANLSWKLALALAGSSDQILNTYHSERHPFGKRAIKTSGFLITMNNSHNMPLKLLLSSLTALLFRSRNLQTFILGSITGLGIRYSHWNLSHRFDPLIGTRCTIETTTGPIFQLLDGKRFILAVNKQNSNDQALLSHFSSQWSPYCIAAERKTAGPHLLIRPDGYVAAIAYPKKAQRSFNIFHYLNNKFSLLESEAEKWLPIV